MNKDILTSAVQDLLLAHEKSDSATIALKKSPFPTVSSLELATQLESRKKAEKKLPLWYKTRGIYFPPSLSIEQASSETTALYKSSLIKTGSTLIDLTGGFGVDSYYFSLRAKEVTHCELNSSLSALVKHNAAMLQSNILFIKGDGVAYLKDQKHYDTIYIDPSRRVNTQKVFQLKDCEPNVIEIQNLLLEKATTVLIKAAPLLDITLSLKDLKYVKEVQVISLKNECKEVLFILNKDVQEDPLINAISLDDQNPFSFSFYQKEETEAQVTFDEPGSFLYDPNVALLKAGAFKLISERYQVQKLHINTHLYTSEERVADFPGRHFEVVKTYEYKNFKKVRKKWKANVISKNFPLKVKELRKRHHIKEDQQAFLLFCKTHEEKLIVIHALRLN